MATTKETPVESGPALDPGFHVMLNDSSLGCYPTAEDAEAYIAGQLSPQDIKAEILEV